MCSEVIESAKLPFDLLRNLSADGPNIFWRFGWKKKASIDFCDLTHVTFM